MFQFFQRILDWFKSLFWKEEMELTLVGLQYSGKTTFVNVIAVGVIFRFLTGVIHSCFKLLPDGSNFLQISLIKQCLIKQI